MDNILGADTETSHLKLDDTIELIDYATYADQAASNYHSKDWLKNGMMTSKQTDLRDSTEIVQFQNDSLCKDGFVNIGGVRRVSQTSVDTYGDTYANFESRKNSMNKPANISLDSIDIKSDIAPYLKRRTSNVSQNDPRKLNKDSLSCRYTQKREMVNVKNLRLKNANKNMNNPQIRENQVMEKRNSKLAQLIKLKRCLIETMMEITEREASGESDDEDMVNHTLSKIGSMQK